MNKNYFDVICGLICNDERMKKFSVIKKEENKIKLEESDNCYEVVYDVNLKKIELVYISKCAENKNLSSWLLDNESATQKDAVLISKDFIDTMAGKEKNHIKQSKKRNKQEDESNVTGLFLVNRMVNIFPELKEEIQNEKENYSEFRAAIFAKENILPKIQSLCTSNKEKGRVGKLGKLLSELYQNGTIDARSIITMGILNGIEGEKTSEYLKSVLSDELKKAWECALNYKGKNIKPEKINNKKSFFSKVLDAQQQSK